MASTGISISKGVTNSSSIEYQIKQKVVEKSDNIVLLADNSKFNIASLMTYCKLKDIHTLVTDKTPPTEFEAFLKENNVNLLIADNG